MDEALVGQRAEPVERLDPELGRGVADRLGRLDRPATREDGKPFEETPLGGFEEVVAPVDCPAECLLPRRQVRRAADEQGQALLEPLEDGRGREGA